MHWLHDIVSHADLALWAELALVVFFITFVAILAWVYFVRRPHDYEAVRSLPLQGDATPDSKEKRR